MITLIVSVILFIVAFILLGIDFNEGEFKIRTRQLLSFLAFSLCLFNLFTVIPANTVGVQYSPFTGVREETLAEGLHGKGFFDKIYKISTEVQTKKLESITGQTKDSQYITMVIDVKYQVNTASAYNVFRQFKTLNAVDRDLISPTVQRSIETITTQYNIIEILGAKSNDVYAAIETELRNRFSANGINLQSITLVDKDAGDAIETAIQNEAVAKKAVETATQERAKAEIEAQKRVIEAQAEKEKAKVVADTQVIQAEADAKTRIINAEANAKAYAVMNTELTQVALDKMWIDKWDGKMPSVVTGNGGMMYDVSGVVK